MCVNNGSEVCIVLSNSVLINAEGNALKTVEKEYRVNRRMKTLIPRSYIGVHNVFNKIALVNKNR